MTSSRPTDTTLGELRAVGYRPRSVKEEMRGNLIGKIESGERALPRDRRLRRDRPPADRERHPCRART